MFNPLSWFRPKIGLLPYIRKDVVNFAGRNNQIMGWEIVKFNIPELWQKSQGDGVVVAVIDTGCDLNHEDLKPNLLEGINFVEKRKPPIDRAGHGTHVSSTIAACNNEKGIVGVAPKAKIIPVKALDDNGMGAIDDIAKAIIWAADRGVDIITMSLGSPQPAKILEDAIKYAYKKECAIFCAAGNSGPDIDIMYPAKFDHTVAVGAIDQNLERTEFTCSGQSLDFLAPGHNIMGCVPNNEYALMSGTSMSNPFVAGCAALALSYARQTGQEIPRVSEDYIDLFKRRCAHLRDPRYANKKRYEGYGILYPRL